MTQPSVTITILAYRSRETIRQCLLSAFNLDYGGHVTIRVREQGGDDREYALLQEIAASFPAAENRELSLTRGANIGFAAGHNALIRESASDCILCLNADAVLMPNFLERAMPWFHDERVGAVQGKVLRWPRDKELPMMRRGLPPPLNDIPRIIDTTGLVPLCNRRIVNRGQGEEDRGQYDVPSEIFGADGAVPIYRRAALEDIAVPRTRNPEAAVEHRGVEFFDEDFFAYKEDVDLAWRLQWRGWKTMYEPNAVAWHGRGSGDSAAHTPLRIIAERRKISPEAKYYSFGNQRLMQVKNETAQGLARDLLPFACKELGAWAFALATEPRAVPAILRMLRLLPRTRAKRRWIMAHRKPGADPYRWFQQSPKGSTPPQR